MNFQFQSKIQNLKNSVSELIETLADNNVKSSFEEIYINASKKISADYDTALSLHEGGYSAGDANEDDLVQLKNKINAVEGSPVVDIWIDDEDQLNADEVFNYLNDKLIELIEEGIEELESIFE